MSGEADLPAVPDDAGDTRGAHFGRLLRHPATLIITVVLVIGSLVAGASAVNAAIGVAAGVAVIVALIVVWAIANSRAHEDFFNAYARGRGLTRIDGKSNLSPITPLLQKGDRRYAERFNGVLPGVRTAVSASTPTRTVRPTPRAPARRPTCTTRSR